MTDENSGEIVETDDTQTTQEMTEQVTTEVAPETPEPSSEPEVKEEKPHQENNPPWLKDRLAREKAKQTRLEEEVRSLKEQFEADRRAPEKQLTREDFGDDYEGYQTHIAETAFNRLTAERQAQQQEHEAKQASHQSFLESWQSKVEDFKKVTPDYAEAVKPLEGYFESEALMDLLNADSGPEITYHLANNYAEAERFNKMDQRARDRYIAKREAIFEMSKAQVAPAPVAPVSNAPAPLTKPEGHGQSQKTVSLADFVKQMDESDRQAGIRH